MPQPNDIFACYRQLVGRRGPRPRQVTPTPATSPTQTTDEKSPWLTVKDAAKRARCGVKTIYREVRAQRLRAATVGGRRELRLRPEWVDDWLLKTTTAIETAA